MLSYVITQLPKFYTADPQNQANIGWRTFLMFAIFNYAIIVYSWVFIKETSGKSLEEMEVVFGTVSHLKTPRSHSPNEDQVETIDEESGKRP